MNELQISGHTLRLGRSGVNLRAWDAADEQLIEVAKTLARPDQKVAVLDDNFGAITLGLERLKPTGLADSAVSAISLADNAAVNDLHAGPVLNWLKPPTTGFDVVILRIPKHLAYLEYLLRWANSVLSDDGVIVAGGMIKHLPDRSADVFNQLVTTAQVCPARRKARVVVCRKGQQTLEAWPGMWQGYRLPDSELDVQALPAVFARERLDIGARLLLPAVHQMARNLPSGANVMDLACGNGVLGLAAMSANPELALSFADVSSQAIASASFNIKAHFPGCPVTFYHDDGLPDDSPRYDLILLNPPFHEGGVVGDHIALRLFKQASRHLTPSGKLLVVGNRHLGYHRSLRRFFPTVEQRAANPKFVVFEACCQEPGRS